MASSAICSTCNNYVIYTVNTIVNLKVPLNELLKNFNKKAENCTSYGRSPQYIGSVVEEPKMSFSRRYHWLGLVKLGVYLAQKTYKVHITDKFNTVGLCVYWKSKIYKNNSQSILDLNDTIIRIISEIERQFFQNVIDKFDKTVDVCGVSRGGKKKQYLNFMQEMQHR